MTARELLTKRDTDYKGELQLFYNNALGIGFEDAKATMPMELLRARCAAGLVPGLQPGLHVLGADQGVYLLIARQLFPPTPARELGTWGIVHCEYTPDAQAFSHAEEDESGQPQMIYGRITTLMQEYDVRLACLDAQPDLSNLRSLQRDCPTRVWGIHSSGQLKALFQASDSSEHAEWPMATESTHSSFDRLFRAIREKELIFHRLQLVGLPPYPEDASLLQVFTHINNLAKAKRTTESKLGQSVQPHFIYVPRGPVKTHPIHYATAATKLIHAIRLYLQGYGIGLTGIVPISEAMLTFQQREA